jgi:hypothetical protein
MPVRVIALAALALGLVAGCGGPSRPADQRSAPAAATSSPAATGPAPTGSVEPVPSPINPPSVAPNTGTGITGVTVVVGGCPVERVDQPCRERAVSAALAIVNPATNAVVTTVTSGADGVFRVATAPGRYLVRSATPTGPLMSHALPVSVDVQAGHYASVKVRFQSGIQ